MVPSKWSYTLYSLYPSCTCMFVFRKQLVLEPTVKKFTKVNNHECTTAQGRTVTNTWGMDKI